MKKKLNRILCIFFAIALCCSLNCIAYAKDSVSVQLSAIVELSGETPSESESYAIILTDTATGKQYCSTVKGAGEVKLEKLTFDKIGIYNYTVEQASGGNKKCAYDSSVYRVKITVSYAEDGDLSVTVAVYKNGGDKKQDSIVFKNIYDKETTVTTKESVTEKTTDVTVTTKENSTTAVSNESVTEKTTVVTQEETSTVAEESVTEEETTTAVADDYSSPDKPNTGDNSGLSMWMILFIVGFVAVVASFVVASPRKRQDNE